MNSKMNSIEMLISQALEANFLSEKSRKLNNMRYLNNFVQKDQILFTGSSLMEHFPVCELYQDYISNLTDGHMRKAVYNRGIGGFTTTEFLENIDIMLLDLEPSKVFINIGTNDMNDPNSWLEPLISNYDKILTAACSALPNTDFYLMAYYPVNNAVINELENINLREKFKARDNEKISFANEKVKELALKHQCHYIDVNQGLSDSLGNLKKEFTMDGVHMYSDAYKIVFENLKPYL